jgi:hypothetical protein
MLLTADLHLTDLPADEYRWQVFRELRRQLRGGACDIFILGDLCDRKDRHSAALVNRLVAELLALAKAQERFASSRKAPPEIHIIMGNHDKPMRGEAFWSFLSHLPRVSFHEQPAEVRGDLLLLPFTPNPAEAWAELDLGAYRAAFIHQPVTGARGENGFSIEGSPLPEFPKGLRVYAGDIHVPQKVGRVTYVGAPHPIKFGDSYPCRILRLDDSYRIEEEIELRPPGKHMLKLTMADLDPGNWGESKLREGDQVKVRFALPINSLGEWPRIKWVVEELVEGFGAQLCGMEAIVEPAAAKEGTPETMLAAESPEEVLVAFASEEALEEPVFLSGQRWLEEGFAAMRSAKE